MNNKKTKTILSAVLSLTMVIGTAFSWAVPVSALESVSGPVTYTDDYSDYTTENATHNETGSPTTIGHMQWNELGKAGRVIATGENFNYTITQGTSVGVSDPVWGAKSLVNLAEDKLYVQGGTNARDYGVNVTPVKTINNVNQISLAYTVTGGYSSGTGFKVFANAEENSYYLFYHISKYRDDATDEYTPGYNSYLNDRNKINWMGEYAFVAQVINDEVSVIAISDKLSNFNEQERQAQWTVNVNNGVVSWTLDRILAGDQTTKKTWSGSFTEGSEITRLNCNDTEETKVTLAALSVAEYAYPVTLLGNTVNQGLFSATSVSGNSTKYTNLSISGTAIGSEPSPIFSDDFNGYDEETANTADDSETGVVEGKTTGSVVASHPGGAKWVVGKVTDSVSQNGIAPYIDLTGGKGMHVSGYDHGQYLPINLDPVDGAFGGFKRLQVKHTVDAFESGIRFMVDEAEDSYFEIINVGWDVQSATAHKALALEGSRYTSNYTPMLTKVVNGTLSLIAQPRAASSADAEGWYGGTWGSQERHQEFVYEYIIEMTAKNSFNYTVNLYEKGGNLRDTWSGSYTDTDKITEGWKYPVSLAATGSQSQTVFFKEVKLWSDYAIYDKDTSFEMKLLPNEYTVSDKINVVSAYYTDNYAKLDNVVINTVNDSQTVEGVATVSMPKAKGTQKQKIFLIDGDIKNMEPLDTAIEVK